MCVKVSVQGGGCLVRGGACSGGAWSGVGAWSGGSVWSRRGSGASMPCRFPGPHPRGKFRGIWLEGLRAHTQGGSWGIWSRPTPKGEVEGIWSRPKPKGEVEGDLVQACPPPHDSYCCGWYATYWKAFFVGIFFSRLVSCVYTIQVLYVI